MAAASAHFYVRGGDSAHGAMDTAGEEGHEREAAEIEARSGGETCRQTETDGELYFAVHAVGIGIGHGAGAFGRGGLRCRAAADGAKWDAAADRASVERGAVPAERVKSADCGEG